MSWRHEKVWVVIILAAGESAQPRRLVCENPNCGRTMMTVNRMGVVLLNNKGVHWRDLPADVTVIEHKCRGCEHYYKIYTPETVEAANKLNPMIRAKIDV
jgi:hypothetical protein